VDNSSVPNTSNVFQNSICVSVLCGIIVPPKDEQRIFSQMSVLCGIVVPSQNEKCIVVLCG
jgi:hypothetical protein